MAIQKVTKKGKELKLKADQAYAQMKWGKALEIYQKFLVESPGDLRTEHRVADLYRRLKMDSEAIDQYKMVAMVYAKDGFWAKAIALSKIILEIDPNDVALQQQLSTMYAQQDKGRGFAGRTDPGSLPEVEPLPEHPESIELSDETGPEMMIEPSAMAALSIAGTRPREGSITTEPQLDPSLLVDAYQPLGKPLSGKMIPLFSEMNAEELSAVMERLAIRRFPTGALVCEEGDLGRSMYVISEGSVEVFTKAEDGTRIVLGHLSGGDFFGEFGLLVSGRRNASVQAKTDLEAMEITSSDFDVIASKYPRIWVVLEGYLQRRLIDTILQKSPVFRPLSPKERVALGAMMKKRKVSADEVVMHEGTDGDEMFFVKSGRLNVMARQEKDWVVVGELGSGDYFGEVAMLTGKHRTATVKAKTECELFCLSRQSAAPIFKANREILVRLKSKMDERSKEAGEVFKAYQEARTTLELV